MKRIQLSKHYLISGALLVVSFAIFFNTKAVNYINSFTKAEGREVLSTIETLKLNPDLKMTLVKVKENKNLFLEVFVHMNHGLELIETLNLDGEFDAYLILKDRTSNLIIKNIDREPDLEIVAPTYDRQMKPVLNVFKYDLNLEEFRRVDSKYSKPIL